MGNYLQTPGFNIRGYDRVTTPRGSRDYVHPYAGILYPGSGKHNQIMIFLDEHYPLDPRFPLQGKRYVVTKTCSEKYKNLRPDMVRNMGNSFPFRVIKGMEICIITRFPHY